MTFPARGTWIEIIRAWNRRETRLDVPRKGNVDRNMASCAGADGVLVDVPRKGNVDRNCIQIIEKTICHQDVPRKGNVDRNSVIRVSGYSVA